MRNAFTSTELNILRKRPQSAKWGLAIFRPASVCIFNKTEAVSTHPASMLTVNAVSGASADVVSGMTAWLGANPGGSELGKIRVRRNQPNASKLPIAEAGSGLANWSNVNYVTVVNKFDPWIKHPRYDSTASQWRMDYDETFNEKNMYGPLAQAGAPVVGYLSGGKFAASFVGDRSQSMGSGGSAITASSWVFPDGQTVTSLLGTSDNPVVITFTGASPNGAYVSLTVEDANGASHIGRRPIWVFADDTQPARVNFATVQGGIQAGGYKTSIQVASASASEDEFPTGAEIVIFESASYNDSPSTIGGNSPHRSNIVFRGWITDETVRVNPFTSDTLFNAETINGVLQRSEAYDVFHDLANPPTGASHWIEAASLSLDRTAWSVLKNRSTVSDIVDFTVASGLAITEQIEYQSLPRATLWTQLNQNYKERGMLGYVASDMQSSIYAFVDAQITGGSASLPTIMQIIRGDRRDTVQIVKNHWDRNAQVKLYAVTSVTPLGGESPGTVQGYFGGRQEQQRGLLTNSQNTLITWSGNLRAKLNNEYERVVVPLSGNIRIDPVPQSLVSMSLSPIDNSRRISWSNKDFIPHTLQLDYDSVNRVVKSQIEMEAVVNGIGGSAITFPKVTELIPPPTLTPSPNPTPEEPPEQGGGFGTVYVASDSELIRTRDFSATSPVWVNIAPDSLSGDIHDWILDPFRPSTAGYLLTDDGVYKSSDLDETSPSWTLVLDSADVLAVTGGSFNFPFKIIASINYDGYVGFAFQKTSGGTNGNLYYVYSTDGGDSWNYVVVSSNNAWYQGGLDYVPHLVGGGIVLYLTSSSGGNCRLFKSSDGGASWSIVNTQSGPFGGNCVHCPYDGNDNGDIVYWQVSSPGNSSNMIRRSTNSGSSSTTMDIDDGGFYSGGTHVKRTGIEAYTDNRQLMYCWRATGGGTGDVYDIVLSSNAGDTWTTQTISGITGEARASGGFPFNQSQFYLVTQDGVFVSTDRGVTWTEKTGNWTPTTISLYNGVIVPDWTE